MYHSRSPVGRVLIAPDRRCDECRLSPAEAGDDIVMNLGDFLLQPIKKRRQPAFGEVGYDLQRQSRVQRIHSLQRGRPAEQMIACAQLLQMAFELRQIEPNRTGKGAVL
jgi:hypothetical protein